MPRAKPDPNAPPKPPLNYHLFCKSPFLLTDEFYALNPKDKVKYSSLKWAELPADQKKEFTLEAESLKKIYDVEFAEYQKTDNYRKWTESQKEKRLLTAAAASSSATAASSSNKKPTHAKRIKVEEEQVEEKLKLDECSSDVEPIEIEEESEQNKYDISLKPHQIPIFTKDFLKFNETREANMRTLRKDLGQLEEEAALLSKHTDMIGKANQTLQSTLKQLELTLQEEAKYIDDFQNQVLTVLLSVLADEGKSKDYAFSEENLDQSLEQLVDLVSKSDEDTADLLLKNAITSAFTQALENDSFK